MRALPKLATTPIEASFSLVAGPPRSAIVAQLASFWPPPGRFPAITRPGSIDDVDAQAADPEMIARLGQHPPASCNHRQILFEQVARRHARVAARTLRLQAVAIIDDRADRHAAQQFGDAADMVGMKMADDEIVDPAHAERLCRLQHARGAGWHCRRFVGHARHPAGVDQQRFALGRDVEGAAPALHVDQHHAQLRIGLARTAAQQHGTGSRHDLQTPHAILP